MKDMAKQDLKKSEHPESETRGTGPALGALLLKFRAFVALIVIMVLFTFLSSTFLTWSNLITVLVQSSINGLLAIGMTLVIVSGGIDLSVGAIAGLCGMVVGALIDVGIPIHALGVVVYPHAWAVVLIGIAAGALAGAVNGWIITRLNVAPFIATLGTLYIGRGLALLSNNGSTFPFLDGTKAHGNMGFPWLGNGLLLDIPVPIWLLAIATLAASAVATRTTFGRHIYAVGGNERAAALSGVKVRSVRARVYVISGALSALAGIVIAAQLDSAGAAAGTGYELNAIAAAVLGGTSLMGGKGTITGSVIGALVIAVLVDGLILLGVSDFWQMIITGFVIVVAVAIDQVQFNAVKFPWRGGAAVKR
ncbi:ABC transporter permease [Solirhodobacter olei]|uniref:ABC transporter permease n=1 Tax=Solirhodobacter olei TaxID=2493082 RepID=UPI0013E37EBB|nr:ABC transporter permease [Solirhodobacter olei]